LKISFKLSFENAIFNGINDFVNNPLQASSHRSECKEFYFGKVSFLKGALQEIMEGLK
jgi:hypothetical protein